MYLGITSLGMISSVGRDVVTSCASIRAGISRHSEIGYFEMLDYDLDELTPLIGHPILAYTEGFNIVGLWIRVAVGCIEDLICYGTLPQKSDTTFWEKTGVIAVTPVINDDRFDSDADLDLVKESYLYRLFDFLDFPVLRNNLDVVCMDHYGTIEAIKQAAQKISESYIERVIVLAVDSYLDPLTLEWLSLHKRLKTSDNPVGLAPGEAGACFMLESLESSSNRKAHVEGIVKGFAEGLESNHYFTKEVNSGFGLSNAINDTLSMASLKAPFIGDIISDLNGENWKARELACARLRVGRQISPASRLSLPCETTGETGTASGAVAVCVAVRSFVRNYSMSDDVLITSSSDYGQVGAACLSRCGKD